MDKEIDKIKNACILLRNARGYILCVQLNNGKWTIPGGKINKGEKKWHAAVREFKEETCHDIPKDAKLYCIDRYYADERMYYLFFYRTKQKFFVKIDWEHEEVGWFKKENLPQPMAPQILDAISRM